MSHQTPADLCRDRGLTLVTVLVDREDACIARVRDTAGADLVLKRMDPVLSIGPIAALRAWTDTGLTPRFHAILAPGLYLSEWMPGPTMADLPADGPVDARAIGRALAVLHRTTPPPDIQDFRTSFAWLATTWDALPSPLIRVAEALTAQLSSSDPGYPALLHGDMVPYNVVLTSGGPRFIDPLGTHGLPAWDLAKLALAWEALGRRGNGQRILSPLLQGYGTEPPLLAETLTWTALVYLQKNLPFRSSPLHPHLLPLIDELLAAETPERFLKGFLGH